MSGPTGPSPPPSAVTRAIGALVLGRALSRPEAEAAMQALLGDDLDAAGAGALLATMAIRGITAPALAGFATVMRQHAVTVPGGLDAFDTCGTGGSGLPTLNTSTLAAFVLAAAGVRVAKHGNRASSGRCGSMDVLEHLGVDIELDLPRATARLADGLVFLNARRHHPALGPLAAVRRSVGVRTIFNLLGPLCNPAGVGRQLLGVSDVAAAPLLAETLAALGCARALVVHGDGGLDELALSGPTRVWRVEGDRIEAGVVTPEDAGLPVHPFEDIIGGTPEENARDFNALLDGTPSAYRDAVLLNSAAALVVADAASDLKAGVEMARHSIDSGAARDKITQVARITQTA